MVKNFIKKLCYVIIILTLFYEAHGRPHGLRNFGSTCYINSVLQAFYALDPVTAYLLTLDDPYVAIIEGEPPIAGLAHYYLILLKQLALLPATPKGTAHAADVLDHLWFVSQFKPVVRESTKADHPYIKIEESPGKKLTSTEFPFTLQDINYIKQLDTFYIQDLAPFLYRATFQTIDVPENVTKLLAACPQEDVPLFIERLVNALIDQDINHPFANTHLALKGHPLGKLFRIEIDKTIKCIDSTHTKTDQESRLNLQTTYYDEVEKKEKNFMTLQACIEHTLSGEIIDYTPYGSSVSKRCTQKQQLMHLSDIVILALKRFGYDKTTKKGIKFKHKINVPLEYDFARHLPKNYPDQTKYELIAAVEHLGDYDSGHYITYVREGKQWYICNDEHVFAVTTKDIGDYSNKWGAQGKNKHRGIDYAYVYFYQKSTAPFQPKVPKKPPVEKPTEVKIPQEPPPQQGDIKQLLESLQALTQQFKILEQLLVIT